MNSGLPYCLRVFNDVIEPPAENSAKRCVDNIRPGSNCGTETGHQLLLGGSGYEVMLVHNSMMWDARHELPLETHQSFIPAQTGDKSVRVQIRGFGPALARIAMPPVINTGLCCNADRQGLVEEISLQVNEFETIVRQRPQKIFRNAQTLDQDHLIRKQLTPIDWRPSPLGKHIQESPRPQDRMVKYFELAVDIWRSVQETAQQRGT